MTHKETLPEIHGGAYSQIVFILKTYFASIFHGTSTTKIPSVVWSFESCTLGILSYLKFLQLLMNILNYWSVH